MKRWIDAAVAFRIYKEIVRKIFDIKLALAMASRSSWPAMASFEEDLELRNETWNEKNGESRLMMLDHTNVNLTCKTSDAHAQRLTCSNYYGSNCAKGSVYLQYFSWVGVYVL